MEVERRCAKCGKVIPWGESECPMCSEHATFLWSLRRDTFLLLTFLVLILLFIATGFAAKFYHAKERASAREWYNRGEAELKAGRASAAVEDFRDALAYSRDDPLYRLRLGQALVAAGRLDEARARLLALWEREPGNGTVNLELARLAVHQGALTDALRYYHNAIYGEWETDPAQHRRETRLELARFLLSAGEKAQAQSELIALAADLPRDATVEAEVGTLLLAAGEHDQALKLFREALDLRPRLGAALLGAGEVYYDLGDYRSAQVYLGRALEENPHLPRAASLAATSRAVLDADPFQRRLSRQERGHRTFRAFQLAIARLLNCAATRGVDLRSGSQSGTLQSLYAQAMDIQPDVQVSTLSDDADLRASTMDLVFDIEKITASVCGSPQGPDLALLLLGRTQGGGRS
jgi:tetratricopeptide (TPR) repeat protein